MRRFIFRLEAVLRHRETVEGLREQEFAQAQGHVQVLRTRLLNLQAELHRVVSERPGKVGEPFDAHQIYDRERYLATLQAAMTQQERRVETAQIIAEEKRQELMTARQAREAVEQLREKDRNEYNTLAQKAEQDTLDEQATIRYIRAQMQKAA